MFFSVGPWSERVVQRSRRSGRSREPRFRFSLQFSAVFYVFHHSHLLQICKWSSWSSKWSSTSWWSTQAPSSPSCSSSSWPSQSSINIILMIINLMVITQRWQAKCCRTQPNARWQYPGQARPWSSVSSTFVQSCLRWSLDYTEVVEYDNNPFHPLHFLDQI